jgi:hypothetical protein
MLQTIEVHIDTNGYIHPIEPIKKLPMGRALLTLLENPINTTEIENNSEQSFDNLFGILTANHSVSLEEMEQTLAQQGQEAIDDRN